MLGVQIVRLSVATNFRKDFIPAIAKYNTVKEIYGKLSRDFVGGGRSSYMFSHVGKKNVEEHVRDAHRHGIRFNYLLNASCLGNAEFTKKGQRQIEKLMNWLSKIKVDEVTVANPFLLALIKKRYPQFTVRISVFAHVDSVPKAKKWADAGADSVVLDSMLVNRDFDMLENIRKSVKIDLQLLANNHCHPFCHLSGYHMNMLAHSSQCNHASKGFVIDYCFLNCSGEKLKDPVNFVRAEWIRPEDIHLYEAMGYDHFKLVERGMPTALLEKRVKAYTQERYDGNLLDLVQPYDYPDKEKSKYEIILDILHKARYLARPGLIRMRYLFKLKRLIQKRGMLFGEGNGHVKKAFLDNNMLDGFLETVSSKNCRSRDCDECLYCHQVAAKAFRVAPKYKDECLSLYQEISDAMLSGEMWKQRGKEVESLK